MREETKLIAEFMGAKVYHSFGITMAIKGEVVKKWRDSGLICGGMDNKMLLDMCKFDKEWNWLMPVVEKIENLHDDHHGYFQVHIHSNACDIQGTNLWKAIEPGSTYGDVYMSDPNAILNTKIESTYHNVIQFIKWYNGQKA